MQQIILVLSAVILGLAFGHLTGGFAFSSAVCLVAGVFLVTPSLFKFRLADLSLISAQMPAIGRNLWINYLLLVAAALAIGWLSRDIGIAGALLLLASDAGSYMTGSTIKVDGGHTLTPL